MKVRYDLMMRKELEVLSREGRIPRLLLHVCCAPCSSGCLEQLCSAFQVVCYYYNPNISPRDEHDRRFEELRRLASVMPLREKPDTEMGPYDEERFHALSKGLEDLPEGGERCRRCFALRLEETARKAADEGFEYFTTTLSVSPYKNAASLNEIGAELAERYGVKWLYADFKKNDGYLRSIRLSREYQLYRQDYCGCVFSREAARRRRPD